MKEEDFSKDFILFGIQNSENKPYTNPEDYAKAFQKCSAPIEVKNIKISSEFSYVNNEDEN